MSTVANVQRSEGSHFYLPDGTPLYCVQRSDGKGERAATLRDARKVSALPSVTTILRAVNKPGLNRWLTEQSCLAVLTSPRLPDEALDEFVDRVLNREKVQDEEGQAAADRGTAIHAAVENALNGLAYDLELTPYVLPVLTLIMALGRLVATEKVLLGDGYAGRADAIMENETHFTVIDLKSCKSLPKEAWFEHRLQLAALAAAMGDTGEKRINVVNIYCSTTAPGECVPLSSDWQENWAAFEAAKTLWQAMNNYKP